MKRTNGVIKAPGQSGQERRPGRAGHTKKQPALFAPGRIFYTPAAQAAIRQLDVSGLILLCRHICGEWGDIDPDRRALNEAALEGGPDEEIVSHYVLPGPTDILLITGDIHTPSRRQTDICLLKELVPADDEPSQTGDGWVEAEPLPPLSDDQREDRAW